MTKPQKKTASDLGELHPKEVELLYVLRNTFRWGQVNLEMKNGIPFRILKAYVTHAFGEDNPDRLSTEI